MRRGPSFSVGDLPLPAVSATGPRRELSSILWLRLGESDMGMPPLGDECDSGGIF